MGLQHKHKSSSGYDQYQQLQQQKAAELKNRLVTEAENKVVTYLQGKYGAVKLERESKIELTARKGSQDNIVFDGTITVFAQLSAGAAAKRLSMTARVAHSTVSLPKYKFIDKIVADTKVEGELKELLPEKATPSSAEISVDLAAFQLANTGERIVDVFHPVYGEAVLGKLSEQEYDSSDKAPLIPVGLKGTFSAEAKKALAGKSFEVKDTDGDMVQLEVGKVSGWLPSSEVPHQVLEREVKKSQIALGEKVLITSELKEYYGDTIVAADIVGKEATIARLNDSEIVLTVDKVAEDVVLSRDQANVLQATVTAGPVTTPTKLEALLRTMVADRFPNNTLRFVGKFKAPEPITAFVPVKASIEKTAAIEDKDMPPQELELKFKQSSGFNQFMASEMQKVASKKRSLVERASSELAVLLNKSFSPTRILATTSALEFEYEKGHTGKVVVSAEVMDNKGIKRISVDIPFVNDTYQLPKDAELAKLVDATISEQEKFTAAADKEASVRIARIEAEVAFDQQRVEAALRPEGPRAKPAPKMDKKAGVGSMQPQEANIQPVFQINKAFLPQSLQVGAVIDLDGLRYRLISKTQGQLSKGEDASQWSFERVWSTGDEGASYHIMNY